MTSAATYEEFNLRRTVVYSLLLHGALAGAIVASALINRAGNPWGGVGGGGSTKVTLVGSVGGIPLPNPAVTTNSAAVDPTKGLYKEEPKPKQPEPKTDAQKIPQFAKNKKLPPSHQSRVFEDKTPPPQNAVPYGQGGQPNLPVGPGTGSGSNNSGGVAMAGEGGGDFLSRYGWYVESVKRRISSNWMQNSIDARVLAAGTAHCVVSFTIMRDGSVKDIHIKQTSGNSSYDNSGLRAVLSSSPMPALPGDYSGSYVNVDFDFDLGMRR
jgi:protein TonB